MNGPRGATHTGCPLLGKAVIDYCALLLDFRTPQTHPMIAPIGPTTKAEVIATSTLLS